MQLDYIKKFWLVLLISSVISFLFFSFWVFNLEEDWVAILILSLIIGITIPNIYCPYVSPFKTRERQLNKELIKVHQNYYSGWQKLQQINVEFLWLQALKEYNQPPLLGIILYGGEKYKGKYDERINNISKEEIELPKEFDSSNLLHKKFKEILIQGLKSKLDNNFNPYYYEYNLPVPLSFLKAFKMCEILYEDKEESYTKVKITEYFKGK